jgi:hypothetical protein
MNYVAIYLGVTVAVLFLMLSLIHSSPRNSQLEESFEREARKDVF